MNRSIALVTFLAFSPFSCFSCSLEGDRFYQLSPSSDVILAKTSPAAASNTADCQITPDSGEFFSPEQMQTLAKRVTVLVTGDNNRGSGTLLALQGSDYLVITNAHVVRGVNSIRLQTASGKTYSAQIVPETNLEKYDLALLKFQTPQKHCLAGIATGLPNVDMPVTAAGFSAEKGKLVFSTGEVKQVASRPLKEGYQIGYSSDIVQGMSGGAIINTQGELIGINGRSAYPILNTGYVYQDGSRPSSEQIQQMRSVSWGIPVSTFLAQVNRDILTAYSLPLPDSRPSVPQGQLTGWLGELEQKAQEITVKIDSSSAANGSGIIIAKVGNTYTVLTAAHVVCERQDATQPCGNESYHIIAPDGEKYPIDKSTIKIESGVDLAVVKFTSQQSYQVATLADYNPNDYDYMFTAGYPKLGDESPWRFTAGQIFGKEQGLLQLDCCALVREKNV